jgi:hypothetical protein
MKNRSESEESPTDEASEDKKEKKKAQDGSELAKVGEVLQVSSEVDFVKESEMAAKNGDDEEEKTIVDQVSPLTIF